MQPDDSAFPRYVPGHLDAPSFNEAGLTARLFLASQVAGPIAAQLLAEGGERPMEAAARAAWRLAGDLLELERGRPC